LENAPAANGVDISAIAANLETEIKEAQDLIQACQERPSDDSDGDGENWKALKVEKRGGPQSTLSDAVDKIRFYVSRLMDLQPAIEGLLCFQRPYENIGAIEHDIGEHMLNYPLAHDEKRHDPSGGDSEMINNWEQANNSIGHEIQLTKEENPPEDNMSSKVEAIELLAT